ncbi:hypothetical protein O6H91_01G024100 [Diphasiastrum complanatum]|uniref:Uncharacterized protein n=1 Tax=Diphasiastrum complanatum TaxID=34168 RepID=A0ACC2EP12_DIPCM|nr:hypothetical protein O6H91_01G024100 [Diphasiastrum complanatum]
MRDDPKLASEFCYNRGDSATFTKSTIEEGPCVDLQRGKDPTGGASNISCHEARRSPLAIQSHFSHYSLLFLSSSSSSSSSSSFYLGISVLAMAVRLIARRLGCAHNVSSSLPLHRAAYSSGKRVLGEEEQAAETVYIKKAEKEKLEKLASKAIQMEEKAATEGVTATPASDPEPARDNSKFIAYAAAGVIAVAAGSWWLGRSSVKEKEKTKE